MARRIVPLVVLLLVCPSILLAQAPPAGGAEERGMVKVYALDPNSTFQVGTLQNVFPLDTIQVPVYFSTARSVTEIQNIIFWDPGDLTLLDITAGPALPDTASFSKTIWADSLRYTIGVDLADSFAVAPDEPIAMLEFSVSCFGYGTFTEIGFEDVDDFNYYIAGGHSYAPLREDGKIWTETDGYWDAFVGGTHEYVFTGEDSVSVGLYFQQSVPGHLTSMKLYWDPAKLQRTSITADPAVIDTFTWSMSGDTMLIDIDPGLNPILPAGEQVTPFTLLFDVVHCDHDVTDVVNVIEAVKKDECGGVRGLLVAPGFVHIRDFTTEVDIADVYCYDTAEYYQVPVYMDATQPVNRFELYVDFPADSLEFVGVVNYGSFTVPGAFVTGPDSSIIKITSGVWTGYDPEDLPSRVFDLKFKRRYTPDVGKVFDLTFNTDPTLADFVQYYSDYCGYYDAGSIDLVDGSITIRDYVPPPPPCPTLYVWSGGSFVRENTILSACANGPVEDDVDDYYLIGNSVEATEEGLRFQIREDATETSFFSGFRLVAVDHPESEPVRIDPDGGIITLGSLYGVAWARDHTGTDITDLVGVKDKVPYCSEENGWFDVSFGKLRPAEIANFVAALTASRPKDPPAEPDDLLKAGTGREAGIDRKLKVFVRTKDDDWSLIAEQDPRAVPSEQATVIDPKIIDPDREFVLRYQWEEYYRIDAVEFREARPFDGDLLSPALLTALHSDASGKIAPAAASPQSPLVLRPGEKIDLVFDASSLRPIPRGVKRDYVFVSTGRYETIGEGPAVPSYEDALGTNYPNPFNPSTSISYSIGSPGQVELKIFDVRGSLVRTLVSGFQAAGEKTVTWDGLSDGGMQAASGVYFYRLKTPGFSDTRKMILLR